LALGDVNPPVHAWAALRVYKIEKKRRGKGDRVFLERVFLIFPSVSSSARMPLTLRDLTITAGFLALFVLSRRWFFAYFKPVLNLPHTGH